MKFPDLMEIVQDEPVFDTGILLAGDVDPDDVRRQVSRWTRNGRLIQLRRGLYALAPPFRKIDPYPFHVANRMVRGSYVSCQSALSQYGMIPEMVVAVTSVTTGRKGYRDTPLGSYIFRHVKSDLFFGYTRIVSPGTSQSAFVAHPEKALLDLVYLTSGGDSMAYIRELRLQNTEMLDMARLDEMASRANSPKLERAAARIARFVTEEEAGWRTS